MSDGPGSAGKDDYDLALIVVGAICGFYALAYLGVVIVSEFRWRPMPIDDLFPVETRD